MWDINLKFTSDMQCINLLWIKVALLEFFWNSWLFDLQFCKGPDCQILSRWLEIYLREQIVTRSCIGGLFNFNISKLKTYQFTIVLITTGWTWELVLGNMSRIGNWLQLRYRQVKKKAEGPINLICKLKVHWLTNWLTS